jgi:hypothetical protein
MHEAYEDIISRISEAPTWYDQNGTPRYGKFTPDHCPNIYSSNVILMKIACQFCGQRFHVEMHTDIWDERISPPKKWHYGDPPRNVCDGGGDTMNCEDLAVLEVWSKTNPLRDWKR